MKRSAWTSILILAIVLGFDAGTMRDASATPQPDSTICVWDDGPGDDFVLNVERLAVRYAQDRAEVHKAWDAAKHGVPFYASEPTGIDHGYLLSLTEPLADEADAEARVRALLASTDVEFAAPVFQGVNGGWITLTNDILLRFKSEFRMGAAALLPQIAPELEVVEQAFGGMQGAYKLRSASRNGFDVLASVRRIIRDPRIAWVEPDAQFSGSNTLVPNDPLFPDLWGLDNTGQFGGTPNFDMDAPQAWNITMGDPDIKILVIDTGVEQGHPDINQLPGADFTGQGSGGGPFNNCDNHGTAVAGCITGRIDNNMGAVGIAPACRVLSARTFVSNMSCNGTWTSQLSWTIDALNWGLTQGARVTNNSNTYDICSQAINDRYYETKKAGMVHFASAGNDFGGPIRYPACIEPVNAVASLEPSGGLAPHSNYGLGLAISAPGQSIVTTDRLGPNGYCVGDFTTCAFGTCAAPGMCGTSFASPYAAGVAALILSVAPGTNPSNVERQLYFTAVDLGTPGYDQTFGWGFVNAFNAINGLPPTTIEVDLEDFTAGSNITGNPGQHALLLSKGFDVTGTPSGILFTTTISGPAGATNIVMGYAEPDFLESDKGLSDSEVLNIDFMAGSPTPAGPVRFVEIQLTTAPITTINNVSSTVDMTAYDTFNNVLATTSLTFTGVTNNVLTPATIALSRSVPEIARVELQMNGAHAAGGVYLESICFDAETITAVGAARPRQLRLGAAHPNPFNPRTRIEFEISQPSHTMLQVYDVRGRVVRTLVRRMLAAERYSVVWNGRDDHGNPVGSGTYFYTLRSGSERATRKFTLLQ